MIYAFLLFVIILQCDARKKIAVHKLLFSVILMQILIMHTLNIWQSFQKTNFVFTKASVKCNENYGRNCTCYIKRYNRTSLYYFNVYGDSLYDWAENVTVIFFCKLDPLHIKNACKSICVMSSHTRHRSTKD